MAIEQDAQEGRARPRATDDEEVFWHRTDRGTDLLSRSNPSSSRTSADLRHARDRGRASSGGQASTSVRNSQTPVAVTPFVSAIPPSTTGPRGYPGPSRVSSHSPIPPSSSSSSTMGRQTTPGASYVSSDRESPCYFRSRRARTRPGTSGCVGPRHLIAFVDSEMPGFRTASVWQVPLLERPDVGLVFGDATLMTGSAQHMVPRGSTCFQITPPHREPVDGEFVWASFDRPPRSSSGVDVLKKAVPSAWLLRSRPTTSNGFRSPCGTNWTTRTVPWRNTRFTLAASA